MKVNIFAVLFLLIFVSCSETNEFKNYVGDWAMDYPKMGNYLKLKYLDSNDFENGEDLYRQMKQIYDPSYKLIMHINNDGEVHYSFDVNSKDLNMENEQLYYRENQVWITKHKLGLDSQNEELIRNIHNISLPPIWNH